MRVGGFSPLPKLSGALDGLLRDCDSCNIAAGFDDRLVRTGVDSRVPSTTVISGVLLADWGLLLWR